MIMALFPCFLVCTLSVFVGFFPCFFTRAQTRISSQFFDRSQVGLIYIKPGLSSVIQFPCDIDEAKVGLKSSLEVQVSKTLKSELVLSARTNLVDPTNLIVRCSHGLFVFDVIANQKLHQDVIKILGAVKGPTFTETVSDQTGKSSAYLKESPKESPLQSQNQKDFPKTPSLIEILKRTAKRIDRIPSNPPSTDTSSNPKTRPPAPTQVEAPDSGDKK
ncbi:MAG: hypothetical protein IPL83_07400 [Bdellovibrionales bacterium]|nr:hypothetical protein [Bdellovibrionales bacterium]